MNLESRSTQRTYSGCGIEVSAWMFTRKYQSKGKFTDYIHCSAQTSQMDSRTTSIKTNWITEGATCVLRPSANLTSTGHTSGRRGPCIEVYARTVASRTERPTLTGGRLPFSTVSKLNSDSGRRNEQQPFFTTPKSRRFMESSRSSTIFRIEQTLACVVSVA